MLDVIAPTTTVLYYDHSSKVRYQDQVASTKKLLVQMTKNAVDCF